MMNRCTADTGLRHGDPITSSGAQPFGYPGFASPSKFNEIRIRTLIQYFSVLLVFHNVGSHLVLIPTFFFTSQNIFSHDKSYTALKPVPIFHYYYY